VGNEWLTAREAASIVRIHPVTLLRWAREGKVPHRRLSARKIVFSFSQLTAWLEAESYNDGVGHAAQPERTVA
jgi:excisionase family DNA binding protein